MLYEKPIGTRVQIRGRNGILTNKSALEIRQTYEITYDDSTETKKHIYVIDQEKHGLTIVLKADIQTIEQLTAKREELLNEIAAISEVATNEKELLDSEVRILKQELIERSNEIQTITEVGQNRLQEITDQLFEIQILKQEEKRLTEECNIHAGKVVELQNELTEMKRLKEEVTVLDETNILRILKESGGDAKVAEIAKRTNSSAKAVYRYCKKLMGKGILILGKLPDPDHKEENVNVWLEGQQEVSEPEIKTYGDAERMSEDIVSSEELPNTVDDKGDSERSEDEEKGDSKSG